MRLTVRRTATVVAGALLVLSVSAGAKNTPLETTILSPSSGPQGTPGQSVDVTGRASGPQGVVGVEVTVRQLAGQLWLRSDGSWDHGQASVVVDVTPPGATQVTWSLAFTPPVEGAYQIEARAVGPAGSKAGAPTSRTIVVQGEPPQAATSTPTVVPDTETPSPTYTPTPTETATPVDPEPPVAEFTADPTLGRAPFVVQFTDLSTGTIDTWAWKFGDGGTSSEQNPTHTYTVGGTYTVFLTVSGPLGEDVAARVEYITVFP